MTINYFVFERVAFCFHFVLFTLSVLDVLNTCGNLGSKEYKLVFSPKATPRNTLKTFTSNQLFHQSRSMYTRGISFWSVTDAKQNYI